MADLELTFDEVFGNSRQPSQQQLPKLRLDTRKSPGPSFSPMQPKAPFPTTTVTPILTPAVNKPPWNYTVALEEAFPDAKFDNAEDEEAVGLMQWLKLQEIESPDEDRRLAALIHDRLGWKDEEGKEDEELYLVSGALPNDGEEDVPAEKAEVELGSVPKDDGEDQGGIQDDGGSRVEDEAKGGDEAKKEDKGKGKHSGKKSESKKKENVRVNCDSSDSEQSDCESDEFDEMPYGTGFGGGWL